MWDPELYSVFSQFLNNILPEIENVNIDKEKIEQTHRVTSYQILM